MNLRESVETQISAVEALIRSGKINPGNCPLYELLLSEEWRPHAKVPPPIVVDIPQNLSEATGRQSILQAWLQAGLTYESFREAFGPNNTGSGDTIYSR